MKELKATEIYMMHRGKKGCPEFKQAWSCLSLAVQKYQGQENLTTVIFVSLGLQHPAVSKSITSPLQTCKVIGRT